MAPLMRWERKEEEPKRIKIKQQNNSRLRMQRRLEGVLLPFLIKSLIQPPSPTNWSLPFSLSLDAFIFPIWLPRFLPSRPFSSTASSFSPSLLPKRFYFEACFSFQSLYKLLLQGPRTINFQQEQHPEDMIKMVMHGDRPREAEDQPFLLSAPRQPRGSGWCKTSKQQERGQSPAGGAESTGLRDIEEDRGNCHGVAR